MANISSLAVRMTANVNGFSVGMASAGRSVERFSKVADTKLSSVARIGTAMRSAISGASGVAEVGLKALAAGTAVAAASVAAGAYVMVRGVRSVADEIDALSKQARDLNASIGGLGALNFAGAFSDVSGDEIASGLAKMQKRISELSLTGTRDGLLAGVIGDPRKLFGMTADQQFLTIATRLQSVGNHADKLRIAFDLFGRGGGVKLLRLLPDDILKSAQRMQLFGLSVSTLDGSNIEGMNDSFTTLKELSKGVFTQLAVRIAPAITDLIARTEAWATSGGGLAIKVGGALDFIGNGIVKVGRAFETSLSQVRVIANSVAAAFTYAFVESFAAILKLARSFWRGLDDALPGNILSAKAEKAFKEFDDTLAAMRKKPLEFAGKAFAENVKVAVGGPTGEFNLGQQIQSWWDSVQSQGGTAKVAQPFIDLAEDNPLLQMADDATNQAKDLMRVLDPGSALSGTAGTIATKRADYAVMARPEIQGMSNAASTFNPGGGNQSETNNLLQQILWAMRQPTTLQA